MTTFSWVILGIIVLAVLWIITMYNSLVVRRTRVDEAWSDIDVQLKRRYDLIPNLIATVKGYAKHEASVFEKVTEARAAAMGAKTLKEHAQAENTLSQTLKSLFAVSEAYPDLKASQNFLELQDELTDTEDKVQAARRFYNGNVRDMNAAVQTFPTNLLAGMFGFKAREYFELTEAEARNAPKVTF